MIQKTLKTTNLPVVYADVIVPLPIAGKYTYEVPEDIVDKVEPGIRVVVQFGKRKIYTAIVWNIHNNPPSSHIPKSILSVLDDSPVINPVQFRFWEWISSYYLCYLGEVMNAALPSAFKLTSESRVILNPLAMVDFASLNEREYLLMEALHHRNTICISEVSKIIGQQKIIPLVNTLIEKGYILMEEELAEKFKPRKETFIKLNNEFEGEEGKVKELFDLLEKKAHRQLELLMAYIHLSRYGSAEPREVAKKELLQVSKASPASLDSMINKGVFDAYEKVTSRLDIGLVSDPTEKVMLSPVQQEAFDRISQLFKEKDVVLLHGVTSSGKTEIYIKLIEECLSRGKQVLYLLPEIALTTQIINRLRKYFGNRVGVYHSRFNENERVEIWNQVMAYGNSGTPGAANRYDIILGARSAVFMPFNNLGLVIVDEEHDNSFKQHEPAPRYNGRDTAIFLAHLHNAQTILGSATPSIESYFNALQGKYGLVEVTERFGNMELPVIDVVDLKKETRMRRMKTHFSETLIQHLEDAFNNGEQSILFQNRRGFSLRLECETCNWMPVCKNCDVTLVYHKQNNQLRCHYCGYAVPVPEICPECKGTNIKMKGFGTEKVEDELGLIFPEVRITRMDLDTTRSRFAYQKIIRDFEQRKIDILVGTQMVTKGLDFENVSTVGILNADNMLSFPDFRAAERSFQLMAQVSGRSGRKHKRGKVIIQSYMPDHPIIRDVINHDYSAMYRQQLVERRKFNYPPYYRLIHILIKHRYPKELNKLADLLAMRLRQHFQKGVLGPEYPVVSKIKNFYLKQILVKIDRYAPLYSAKENIMSEIEKFLQIKEFGYFRVVVDVDPQ
ncbi:MAG: primosomal protein N' [Bacteroidetes bacterium]|nr:primosomal protein N' [Bacteroidota bacterium]